MKKEILIISFGGSLVFRATAKGGEEGTFFDYSREINIDFLKKFKSLILKYLKKNKFFIFVGGGKICRIYQKAITEFGANSRQLDQLGIKITRLNAQLLKFLFGKLCHPEIIKDPTKKIKTKKDILVAGGYRPGWSTDYCAVLLAKNLGIKKIINLTNIDYVFDKDPAKFSGAKLVKKINWQKFQKIVDEKWSPGLSLPFDPIASKLARKLKIRVILINGKKLERLKNFLEQKPFIGTIIK